MKINTVKEKEDILFNRTEIHFSVDFEKYTPSKDEILKELSNNLKMNSELVSLNKIKQRFGERKADVLVYVYKDKDTLKKVEFKHKKAKKKTETKPAEAKWTL